MLTDRPPRNRLHLERYTRDLTALARRGELDPVIGSEEEIAQVIQTQSRRKKNNPALIGEAGVGETVIGADTLDEYHRFVETEKALERRFHPILVREPSIEETICILQGIAPRYAKHHQMEKAGLDQDSGRLGSPGA
jgi:ATP-dependent Clp protease ATP-binding subunit ClpA